MAFTDLAVGVLEEFAAAQWQAPPEQLAFGFAHSTVTRTPRAPRARRVVKPAKARPASFHDHRVRGYYEKLGPCKAAIAARMAARREAR